MQFHRDWLGSTRGFDHLERWNRGYHQFLLGRRKSNFQLFAVIIGARAFHHDAPWCRAPGTGRRHLETAAPQVTQYRPGGVTYTGVEFPSALVVGKGVCAAFDGSWQRELSPRQ